MKERFPAPELLAPAGSPEAVRAAVESGADAVYMAGSEFNARRNAKNLTDEELAEAISYCRVRGVRTHITVNILMTDAELPALLAYAEKLCRMGADALIVADLGAAALLRQYLPEIELHASTQMTLSTAEGVHTAAQLGFDRAVLARELSLSDIRAVRAASPIPVEVFAHGALCMCWSGQCYLSSLIGRRSGNRGLCAQPCRLPYTVEGAKNTNPYPLSLRDLNLSDELSALREAEVASLKLEGRMKSPGYVAAVTRVYADCLREEREPTAEERELLSAAFSRDGFTKGYFEDRRGPAMFGHRPEDAAPPPKFTAREGHEPARVPVTLRLSGAVGEALTLTVSDGARTAAVTGALLSEARSPVDAERVREALCSTGGTPYRAEPRIETDTAAYLPLSEVKRLRREALEQLTGLRAALPEPRIGKILPRPERGEAQDARYTVRAERPEQITDAVLALLPARIALPLECFAEPDAALAALAARLPADCELDAVIPSVARPGEMPRIRELACAAKRFGARGALISNLGMIDPAREAGLALYGDVGMNLFNSYSAGVLADLGFASAALSFELPMAALRGIASPIPTEAAVYGRLPAMTTENCVLRNAGRCGSCGTAALIDRTGARFPVLRAFGCRSRIVNAHTLWLADRTDEFRAARIAFLTLCFTTEDPEECSRVAACYAAGGGEPPEPFTRGLYYRELD